MVLEFAVGIITASIMEQLFDGYAVNRGFLAFYLKILDCILAFGGKSDLKL